MPFCVTAEGEIAEGDADAYDDPTIDEETRRRHQHRSIQMRSAGVAHQASVHTWFGTPRKSKFPHAKINGVLIR